MTNISVFKKLLFALLCVSFVACDSDFNNINSDIIEDDVHHNGLESLTAEVVAYDRPMNSVQSNNMPTNLLGVYDHPLFGKVAANYVTQLELETLNPSLHLPVINSVYVYIPYFSTLKSTATDGTGTYELNSGTLYGNPDDKMRLRIYESGYYLRSLDPVTASAQKYYSGDQAAIEATLVSDQLNNSSQPAQNEFFLFNPAEIKRFGDDNAVTERLAPGLFAELKTDYFETKLFSATGRSKMASNNIFREYFRGLYFKIEQIGSQNAMALLNTANAKLVVNYTDATLKTDGTFDNTNRVKKTLTIRLKGNSVNYFSTNNSGTYDAAINTSNELLGDASLFIKGGAGSMGVIKLDDTALSQLKRDITPGSPVKAIINEANLTFFVDESAMAGLSADNRPKRVYLYDMANNRPMFDYFTDVTTSPSDPKNNKIVHDGRYAEVNSGALTGTRYRIRITNHINNIINKDSTNVPIGLVITDNINVTDNGGLKNITPFSVTYLQKPGNSLVTKQVNSAPFSSVISPLGIVLYGNNIPIGNANYNKRLKLEIFYTKPE